jgi:uncharacterized phage protein gp47/JayE
MVVIKNQSDITLDYISLLRLTQPGASTNPGSVIRDVAIDANAAQLALLYGELAKSSNNQSLRTVVGAVLDLFAKNFGIVRKQATASTGIAILTFTVLQGTIPVSKGSVVSSLNGYSFQVLNGVSINPAQANFYKSVATKYQNALNFVGITDIYAVEVTVQTTTTGVAGNIPPYSLVKANIPGITNITNAVAFTGGSNQEDDATFRNRILSTFSGSAVGTALGYKNAALAVSGVQDAYVAGPGDLLMTRDGTIIGTNAQGQPFILSSGSGGKVNIYILGTDLVQSINSFIYQDKSNLNDPTNKANNVVLGQIASESGLTITQRRLMDTQDGTLPQQPVDSLIQITGSISGTNFIQQTTDGYGVSSGNFALVKDTGAYGGTPWGFDTFVWASNQITGFTEALVKGKFNGQDPTTYSDVLEIPAVVQNISITNENSTVISSNRSLIQLLHAPTQNATRVFNVNTGERYTVINQNFGGTGTLNTSGVIQISGNTLPSPNDVLQVDYTWVITYDQYSDYDGKSMTNNPRLATDSVDWGYSNAIRMERDVFALNSTTALYTSNTIHPISSVISANVFTEIDGYVIQLTSGQYAGRLAVNLTNLLTAPTSINNVYLEHTYSELYATAAANGTFIVSSIVVGVDLEYTTTIVLPTDTRAAVGNPVSVVFNATDVYNVMGSPGSFNSNQISIPQSNVPSIDGYNSPGTLNLEVVYIASIQTILTAGITQLPISRAGNGYALNNGIGFTNVNPANTDRTELQPIQKNLSNQLFIELSISSLTTTLTASQVVSVIRLSDGNELWNNDNPGTIAIDGTTNNYQLILSGYNTPNSGDRCLIIYFANDIARWQPFTFANKIIERDFQSIQVSASTNQFIVPMHNFFAETAVKFQILEPNTNVVLATASDGYIQTMIPVSPFAIFGSFTINFGNVVNNSGIPVDITSKKIRLLNTVNRNNSNTYDIISYSAAQNTITIGNNFAEINDSQISIVRVLDGKEQWSGAGTIDIPNNRLLYPLTQNASQNDEVIVLFYKSNNLKQTPTRVSLNVSDTVQNSGVLTINGTTITRAANVIFTITATGLRQNLLAAFRTATGLSSNATIPSNILLAKMAKLEQVLTVNPANPEVSDVIATYDLEGTIIQDNTYFIETSFENSALGQLDFILPSTPNNTTNLPTIGMQMRATFYYSTPNVNESLTFTQNGTLYTNNTFALINKIFVSSGFTVSQSAQLTFNNFNQPITGVRYNPTYNYLAPKQNERITITFNYNQEIGTTTLAIENARPIDADVLVYEANQILVNVNMLIAISTTTTTAPSIIFQNVQNALTAAINATSLGTTLYQSALIDAASAVSGVAGATLVQFNVNGQAGSVISITAQNNQYLVANNIVIQQGD